MVPFFNTVAFFSSRLTSFFPTLLFTMLRVSAVLHPTYAFLVVPPRSFIFTHPSFSLPPPAILPFPATLLFVSAQGEKFTFSDLCSRFNLRRLPITECKQVTHANNQSPTSTTGLFFLSHCCVNPTCSFIFWLHSSVRSASNCNGLTFHHKKCDVRFVLHGVQLSGLN